MSFAMPRQRLLPGLRPGALLLAGLLAAAGSAQALDFRFNYSSNVPLAAQQGMAAAAAHWSAALTDPVTVVISVGAVAVPGGAVADAQALSVETPYSLARSRMLADRSSQADNIAVASLATTRSLPRLVNRTRDNPAGAGALQTYVDNTSFSISLTSANARALGVVVGASTAVCGIVCDAFIRFNSTVAFDFDRSDGIAAGQYDFIGVMQHEIGHALGFVSGVDILDGLSPPTAGPFTAEIFQSTALDLFRYSSDSAARGVADFSADTRPKYFSLDRGATAGPGFALGEVHGDGWQAGHWQPVGGLGLMAASGLPGTQLDISANDLLAMDVIGWNLAAPVPEPASLRLWLAGGALLAGLARRRGQHCTSMADRPASSAGHTPGATMAKSQQRSTKEAKKPKKDDSAAKPLSPGAVSAPITTVVMKKGKEAKLK